MARHASPHNLAVQRALIALAAAGAALGAGAATASAAPVSVEGAHGPLSLSDLDPQAGAQAVGDSVSYTTGSVANLKPNPLAGTGSDPLNNAVGTQVADFRPMSSKALTGPVTDAHSVGSVPVVRQVVGAPGGGQG
ncbi:hypothetical protein [Streptomyces sp. NPDC020298]|uniref:hypothetical protein n=1 Tax=unclassified Streptomyces TaxID=2593676 RepID=UPI0033FA52AE